MAARLATRRTFLKHSQIGLGAMALAGLMGPRSLADETPTRSAAADNPLAVKPPNHPPKAKSVIYIHLSGGPPQQDLWDYKPELNKRHMQPCPDSLLANQRFAFIKGHPKLLGSPHAFQQHGGNGVWLSNLLPNIAAVIDDVTVIHSMNTDQFNHAPAELFLYTGSANFGNAAMGSWITYGLGSENQDLPGFVVMISGGTDPTGGKSLWSTGFLPSVYQGVQCRSVGDPILYAGNPKGLPREVRRRSLDVLRQLNEAELREFGDPETLTRISQYELAFRMQVSVPDAMNIASEPQSVLDMYGAKPGAGSLANNILLARRLVERGVRYVQMYDWGWDIHGTGTGDDIVNALPKKCAEMDQPVAALIMDLKARGLLDSTLVIVGGEFGRTSMNEARGGSTYLGRDHHPHCFTLLMAGGGIKRGYRHGATDEFGYFITENKVGIHDLQATILHLVGLNPHRLVYPYLGLDQRLIGPEDSPRVVTEILA
jgi:hypothetical protein